MRFKHPLIKPITVAMMSAAMFALPHTARADYPDKPITLFVAYAAGGSTDVTSRALAHEAEKILGVPIAVENKAGGGATVANALMASRKPDGYTLLITSTGSMTMRPLLLKLAYKPDDFRVLMKYSEYVGSLVVNADAPWKNINEFIEHAQKNPGMSYASAGTHTQQQVAVESLAQCKGLQFKHVPTKGGSAANTALMGKHVDFAAGSGAHLPLVEQGVMRELIIFHRNERHPKSPDTPVMKDINCPPTNPASGLLLVAPAGLPDPIAKKLTDAFKKASESPEFQKLLDKYQMPYIYQEGATVMKDIPPEIDWYRNYFKNTGDLKE